MPKAELQRSIYHDEQAALRHFEQLRWPEGPTCYHCGSFNVKRLGGEAHRKGLFQCNEKECRKQFRAVMGTVFEKSHIPLHKWLLATHLMCSSKKGMSAAQLHRELGFGSYRTAWFMAHRIREAMAPGPDGQPPLGGKDKIVEADETYYGKRDKAQQVNQTTRGTPYKRKRGSKAVGHRNRRPIVSLVERGGSIRSFHVGSADQYSVEQILKANVDRESKLSTDESRLYTNTSDIFAEHGTVKHSAGEYVRDWVHTNSLEGYFSIFKRGMKGVYQHCGEKHLHRYLAEYDFRYNYRVKNGFSDAMRTDIALTKTIGKRLTYRRPDAA